MGFLKLLLILFLAAGCSEKKDVRNSKTVVATYSILADVTANIAQGSDVEVRTLVPRLSDPHTYEPKPEDIASLNDAKIILAHGLRFEGWLDRILGANTDKVTYIASHHPVRKLNDGSTDPHTWHNPKLMLTSVPAIQEALSKAFPAHAELFKKNAATYAKKLEALDQEIENIFTDLPKNVKRIVLTTHDAFYYFGERYGIEFISPVGITTEAEPKAQAISKIIERIRSEDIRAVFIENLSNQKSLQQIATETNSEIDGTLYADSLSLENGPAATYLEMLRYNTTQIKKALLS